VDANTGKELQPPKLKTVARILTPNPPDALGVEILEPDYLRIMQVVDGIKKMNMES
jgi:hypothetical protein